MKMNKWTMGLAAAGIVSLSSVAQAQDAAAAPEAVATSNDALATGPKLSGYVSTGYHYGNGQEPGGENYFRAADGQNAFSLDVVDLVIQNKIGDDDKDSGYTVELWMGPAASDIGTQDSGNGGTVELMQANIDLRIAGIDLKMGQFGTIVGNESYNYNANTFYTHSWGFAVEPTHHTGLLATYGIGENRDLLISAGLANTTGAATNGSSGGDGSGKTWLASVSYTMPSSGGALSGTKLYYGVVAGPQSNPAGPSGDGSDTEYHFVSLTLPELIPNLSITAAWDHVEYGAANAADSNVAGLYLSYKVGDNTSINARGEIGNINADLDGDGTRQSVDSFENADNLRSLTLGVNHKIWENVTSRLEYRHDRHDSDAINGPNVPDRGSSQDTIALNLIYTF